MATPRSDELAAHLRELIVQTRGLLECIDTCSNEELAQLVAERDIQLQRTSASLTKPTPACLDLLRDLLLLNNELSARVGRKRDELRESCVVQRRGRQALEAYSATTST